LESCPAKGSFLIFHPSTKIKRRAASKIILLAGNIPQPKGCLMETAPRQGLEYKLKIKLKAGYSVQQERK